MRFPVVNDKRQAVFERKAHLVREPRNETRHIVKDEQPLPAHVRRVVLLVGRDKPIDAARELQPAADDITAHA